MKKYIYLGSVLFSLWLWFTIPLTWLVICSAGLIYIVVDTRNDVI